MVRGVQSCELNLTVPFGVLDNVLAIGNQMLNSTVLSCTDIPIEIYSIRYIEQNQEKKNPLHMPWTHQHTFFEVHLPITGEQTYQIGSEYITAKSREMIIISPNVHHSIPYSSDDLTKFTIAFAYTGTEREKVHHWLYAAFHDTENFFHLCNADANVKFDALFRILFAEAADARIAWHKRVVQIAWCIVVEIASYMFPAALEEEYIEFSYRNEKKHRAEEAKRFIDDNLSMRLTCASVAAYMNISVKQLDRDVQKTQNVRLYELIKTSKLVEAKRLLQNDDIPIEEIAFLVGYSEVSSFSRFFKRLSGISPKAYRTLYNDMKSKQKKENDQQ